MRERLKTWLTDLMMIPGLSGYEGRVRRYLKAALERPRAQDDAPTGWAT